MKQKILSWSCLSAGLVLSVVGGIAPIGISTDVNMIGGAGGDTYLTVLFGYSDGILVAFLFGGIALLLTGAFGLIFKNTVECHCRFLTSVMSVGLSAVGAGGIICFITWWGVTAFHEMSRHPVEYPLSVSLGFVCFNLFIGLLIAYFFVRSKQWTTKGLLIDIATAIIYFPACYLILAYFYQILQS